MPYFAIQSPTSGNATQLRGVTVSATAPTGGQVLVYDGSSWTPSAGVTGPTGVAGADAPRLLNGTTGPVSGYGRNGDYFIDTNGGLFYGPKTSGSWGAGLQLQSGPAGPTGPAGFGATGPTSQVPGPTGERGATGEQGSTGAASTVTGPRGETGPSGPTGFGATGHTGPATSLTIGQVSSGGTPSATLTGPPGAQVLSLVLARGATGSPGAPGSTGPIAGLAIGNVTDGGSAGASIYPDGLGGYLLDVTLPRGPTGAASNVTGPTGAAGELGPAGPSVTGPTGAASTVPGPTGPAGAGGGGSFSWASVPSGPTGAGSAGSIAYDSAYFYVATATNTWRRAALSTWSLFRAIPIMTSATAPSGTASASAILGAGLEAWHAFDKETVTSDDNFYGSPSPADGSWLQYDFGADNASLIGGYAITTRNSGYGNSGSALSQAPTAWTLAGSNDGTTFTTIDTLTSQSFTAGQTRTFTLSLPAQYRVYRWTWTATPAGGAVVLPKIQLVAP